MATKIIMKSDRKEKKKCYRMGSKLDSFLGRGKAILDACISCSLLIVCFLPWETWSRMWRVTRLARVECSIRSSLCRRCQREYVVMIRNPDVHRDCDAKRGLKYWRWATSPLLLEMTIRTLRLVANMMFKIERTENFGVRLTAEEREYYTCSIDRWSNMCLLGSESGLDCALPAALESHWICITHHPCKGRTTAPSWHRNDLLRRSCE